MRVTSAQKLPTPAASRRAKPRMNANASAIPVAADRKLCSVSATIWLSWLMVVSGVYDCQLVLVVKLTAVLNARSAPKPGRCSLLSGSMPCTRSIA